MQIRSLFFTIFCFTLLSASAQKIKYSSSNNTWNSDSLGNHRVLVYYNGVGKVARTIIEWRRRDERPADKRIIVQDAKTLKKINNVSIGVIDNEKGEIYFDPISGKGNYYVYYMPYKNEGRSNYPKGVYLQPENTASSQWLASVNKISKINTVAREIQSIDSFNSFYPMEIIATSNETKSIIKSSKRSDFIVFPEDRRFPIKMYNHLPLRWVQKGVTSFFSGETSKGGYYSYQLGVFALKQIEDVAVEFSSLKDGKGNEIPTTNSNCINISGIDYKGTPFKKTINIEAQKIQPLWCGIEVPRNTLPGNYKGTVTVKAKNTAPFTISILLKVNNTTISINDNSEFINQGNLKWLNSTIYQENTVIKPYTPLEVKDNTISLLGRKVELNEDGFPKQIQSFFTEEMTGYKTEPNNILSNPIHFNYIKKDSSRPSQWSNSGKTTFVLQSPGTVTWKAINYSGDEIKMDVDGSIEFDGFIEYKVKLTALKDIEIKDISLQLPLTYNASKYMMGLGQKGGYRPTAFEWKWDVAHKNQDGAWIGNVNSGIQYSLRDEKYIRPLNTNFYLQKPLLLPSSWGNENKGGITIADEDNNTVTVNNYSGERSMKKGDELYYNFNLLITPFHTLNTDFQWQTRFYHRYNDIDTIKQSGATVINIHHATPINPWINYPFIEYKKLKAYIDEAHSKGLKVKIYNTVRELSNHAYETFPLRSLGHEIYSPGKGGGFSWLQEHIDSDYIAAWFVPEIKDAAIINSGMSRWHNYYTEGMNWLVQQVGIDGIYLDDVAFDRITMKRIKRALTQDEHPGIIDLHSANQYNKNDGFNNSANLYMEHFPYLNRLWFGEYFDYNNNTEDFFLTEVSGIPFGLMGEMLQDGGNAWRGLVYGMTNRMPWSENANPGPIWKIWDDFGMKGTDMIGYWSDKCPVKTDNKKVLATVYKKNKSALVAIASWAASDTTIKVNIDWNALNIDPAKASIIVPEIKNFQSASSFKVNDLIPIKKEKGLCLIIKENL